MIHFCWWVYYCYSAFQQKAFFLLMERLRTCLYFSFIMFVNLLQNILCIFTRELILKDVNHLQESLQSLASLENVRFQISFLLTSYRTTINHTPTAYNKEKKPGGETWFSSWCSFGSCLPSGAWLWTRGLWIEKSSPLNKE